MNRPSVSHLSEIAICPACWQSSLSWQEDAAVCTACGFIFPVSGDIWYPIVPDRSWRPIIQDTVALFMDFNANRDAADALIGKKIQANQEKYARDHEAARDEMFFQVWNSENIPKDAPILEIGAGDLRIASELTRGGYSVTAVEPIPELLSRGVHDARLEIVKVCCSGARLPFPGGTFGVVYCHAMLHHAADIGSVIREMARVLMPGGRILIIAEPVNSVLRSIRRLRETTPEFSFDIGINEQMPKLFDYLAPLKRFGIAKIRAVTSPDRCDLPHRLHSLPGSSRFKIKVPEISGAAMRVRHLLMNAEVSFLGERSGNNISPPPAIGPEDVPFDPKTYIFNRHRKSLVECWKSVLKESDIPQEIEVGRNDLEFLRRGFSRRETGGETRPYRWLQAHGAFFLVQPSGDRVFEALVKVPENSKEVALELLVDSESVPPSQTISAGGGLTLAEWELGSVGNPQIREFILKAKPVRMIEDELRSLKIFQAAIR